MTERITPIYSGKREDFTWVGFGSGSGTNLRECAKVIPPALIFSDRPSAKLLGLEELTAAEHLVLNGFKTCGSWKKAEGDSDKEQIYRERSLAYNQQIVDALHRFEDEHGKKIDLIVLGGYMRLMMQPLLEAYKDKIINVHPANLSILDLEDPTIRTYVGDDAVYDAIKAGEHYTRSSVIMVDAGVDNGEILTQGPIVKVWKEYLDGTLAEREECLREYADAHQSLQKVRSDWLALTTALEMIADGRLALGTEKSFHNTWRTVFLDGQRLGYEGHAIMSNIKIN